METIAIATITILKPAKIVARQQRQQQGAEHLAA